MDNHQSKYGLNLNRGPSQMRKRGFGRIFDDDDERAPAPPTPFYPDLSIPARLRSASGYDYYDDTPTRSRIILPETHMAAADNADNASEPRAQEQRDDDTAEKFKKLVDATSVFVAAGADFFSSVVQLGTRALSSYWNTVMASYRENYANYADELDGIDRRKKRRRTEVPGAFDANPAADEKENEENGLDENDERNRAFIVDMPVPLKYTQTRPAFTGRRPLFEPIASERASASEYRPGTPMELDTPDGMRSAVVPPRRWQRPTTTAVSAATVPPGPSQPTTFTTSGSLYPEINDTPFAKQLFRKKQVSFGNNRDFEHDQQVNNIDSLKHNYNNDKRENVFADRLRQTRLALRRPESSTETYAIGNSNTDNKSNGNSSSNRPKSSVLLTNTNFKKYVFDESRIDRRRPLGYPSSWYYKQVELPEETQSENEYIDAYMKLADMRKRTTTISNGNDDRYALNNRGRLHQVDGGVASRENLEALFSPGVVDRVDGLWARRDYSTAVVDAFRITITVYDLQTLRPGHWINDNIVDFYFNLIQQRSVRSSGVLAKTVVFSTHFFSTLQKSGFKGVAKWAERRGIDVTKPDFILVPINRHNIHWCLAVINNRDLRFELYDSMNGAGAITLELLRDYMRKQTLATYPYSDLRQLGYDRYDLCATLPCPQQQNSFDCGAFVCRMANLYAQDRSIMSFAQADIPAVRRQIAYEIVTQSLI
ncbi:hypothetical protein D0Z00_001271 [Geotrichum galactomycetum]|uniref:Uncharacterized protein n=1 Tax=Geotrichum galactomycetum TaxID=27317 RepID=A0ACB6V7H4_9ASCO|nr:hypothetical protein D0Z00_001271 [Geotrichum candidum]